jgi:hypothetical protein
MTKKAIKHAVLGLSLGLTLTFLLVNWTSAHTASAEDNHAHSSASSDLNTEELFSLLTQGGAQEEKPVEQTAKNIKVLNGLPSSRLFPVMNFFSASLGVRCSYCHVSNGDKLDFASDAKEEKETARQMITMVKAVNKDNFSGNLAVTCYTCHRGQAHASGMPPFPIPPRESFLAEPPKRDVAGLPTADQVFDKYMQAIGGKTAFDKLKTRVWKGTIVNSSGSFPFQIEQSLPDKFLATMTTPKQGLVMTGYNGTAGWTQGPRGVHAFGPADLAQFRGILPFFVGINLKEQYTKTRVVGKDKVNDHEAYLVRAVNAAGNNVRLYFDTQTGLLLRSITVERTNIVPIPEQVDFDDYREVDGVKLPFTIQVYNIDPSAGATRKFTEIKHNVSLDDARFNMPAAQAPAAGAKP